MNKVSLLTEFESDKRFDRDYIGEFRVICEREQNVDGGKV
jgi:hypothetical protein